LASEKKDRIDAVRKALIIAIKSNELILNYFKIERGQSRVNNYLCTARKVENINIHLFMEKEFR